MRLLTHKRNLAELNSSYESRVIRNLTAGLVVWRFGRELRCLLRHLTKDDDDKESICCYSTNLFGHGISQSIVSYRNQSFQ